MKEKLIEKLDNVLPEIFNFSEALDRLYISLEETNENTIQKERNGILAMMYIMNEHYKSICEKWARLRSFVYVKKRQIIIFLYFY